LKVLLYDEESDRLSLELEKHDSEIPLLSIEPIRDLVELNLNPANGQLVSVEISGMYKISEGILPESNDFWYSDMEDTLYIHLSEEGKDSLAVRDLVWDDSIQRIAVAFSRNEVGNIVGIEICGVNRIIASTY
jgi:uncharacterized protein YuzE